jgi:hypothetical protein
MRRIPTYASAKVWLVFHASNPETWYTGIAWVVHYAPTCLRFYIPSHVQDLIHSVEADHLGPTDSSGT